MKKITALVIFAVVLAAALAGCAENGGTGTNGLPSGANGEARFYEVGDKAEYDRFVKSAELPEDFIGAYDFQGVGELYHFWIGDSEYEYIYYGFAKNAAGYEYTVHADRIGDKNKTIEDYKKDYYKERNMTVEFIAYDAALFENGNLRQMKEEKGGTVVFDDNILLHYVLGKMQYVEFLHNGRVIEFSCVGQSLCKCDDAAINGLFNADTLVQTINGLIK